jgi:hypothetical protein
VAVVRKQSPGNFKLLLFFRKFKKIQRKKPPPSDTAADSLVQILQTFLCTYTACLWALE